MMIKPNANESSSYYVLATFYDEDDSAVVPDTLKWTLADISGNIVNSRDEVVVSTLNSTVVIALSGDDLAVDGYFSNRRVMTFTGTYTTTISGSSVSMPTNQAIMFDIDRILTPIEATNNLIEMLNRLSVYFGDPKMTKVLPPVRVALLNEAQKKVIPMLNRNALHALDTVLTGQSLEAAVITDGDYSFDLSQLVNPVYHGNTCIDGIRIDRATDAMDFARLISFDEYRVKKNSGYNYDSGDPVYYQLGTRVFFPSWTATDTIDIYYKRQPVEMSLDATDETQSIACDFASDIRDVLVEYAAYWGLLFVLGDDKRANTVLEMAMGGIATLNGTAAPTDSIRREDPNITGRRDFGDFPITVRQYIP